MAHHKRGRPKNRRAGCLLCKPHKANHAPLAERDVPSVRRRTQDTSECDAVEIESRRYDACECSGMSIEEMFAEGAVTLHAPLAHAFPPRPSA